MGRTWRIGEVADRTGLTRRTLRHYDELGLLIPAGRTGTPRHRARTVTCPHRDSLGFRRGRARCPVRTTRLPRVATRLAVVEILGRLGGESRPQLGRRCAE
ncbi:MAG TPA: MerR family DNA-binding transcriptional regulator, partial [Propionibacteriaceae bacterium]